MTTDSQIDDRNINATLFNKVDYKVEALRLAVSMHEPILSDGKQDIDKVADQILSLSNRFLDHFRANGQRH